MHATGSTKTAERHDPIQRLKLIIRGAVQGVGFRPFVYRLATELSLSGWVRNSSQGVFIEVEGVRRILEHFLLRIEAEKPPHCRISSLESSFLDPKGYDGFQIFESDESGLKTALVLPDIATCPDCLREIFDPADRRYLYPFTNCTHCGPRYSIIERLPYDRPNTTMKRFHMCELCRMEYENPLDRRFHAQPNACPECGPHLELWDKDGRCLAAHHDALLDAAQAIRQGEIVAVKGIGGFHLMVDARNDEAVRRLRQRKAREEKPLALMYPSLEVINEHCEVSPLEERLLLSPECPIVLLRRKSHPDATTFDVAPSVAPGNPNLGIMLPYSPLHHILLRELGFPLVATSGNLAEEPICTDENEALDRLSGIADLFLVHNRPIVRHIDDSIARITAGRELVLRRARGYAPLPIACHRPMTRSLAVGGHLKNSVAISVDCDAFVSQHIGDLETAEALDAFHRVTRSLKALYDFEPEIIACDPHPDYLSTKWAHEAGLPVFEVQHHHAHILSCMAENELDSPVLGVSWDGTGYGLDGTVWGGEFLLVRGGTFQRVAYFRTFALPGGEKAIREPRRAALGLLYEIWGEELFSRTDLEPLRAFSKVELSNLRTMLSKKLNCPITSSAGRLFDVLASLLGLRQINAFEGQAAMEVEFWADGIESHDRYPIEIDQKGEAWRVDWEPMMLRIMDDIQQGLSRGEIAARFHNTLVECIVLVADRIGEKKVALSGGCFQNKRLIENAVKRLKEKGFHPYWHQRIPPNDGGIALGQLVGVTMAKTEKL